MPITPEVGDWLFGNGYRNLCFISYPHTGETLMKDFATEIKRKIQEELGYQVSGAKVFIDHQSIPPGAIWPAHLKTNLAGSLAMVAILSQVYFTDAHSWCGKEWAAMEELGGTRLPGSTEQPIIPVLFRRTLLPAAARPKQFIDLSRNSVLGRRFFSSPTFLEAIQRIVEQIESLAVAIYNNRCAASEDQCAWSEASPFSGRAADSQPRPLLSPPSHGATIMSGQR
jgi:hypothetical protein